jgi:hypothetical protein
MVKDLIGLGGGEITIKTVNISEAKLTFLNWLTLFAVARRSS